MQINNLPKPTADMPELKELQNRVVMMTRMIGEYNFDTDPKLVAELPTSLEHVYTRLCEFIEFTRKIQIPDYLETFETIIINLRILHHKIVNKIVYFKHPTKKPIKSEELKSTLQKVTINNLSEKVVTIEAKCEWLIEKYRS